MAFAGFSRQMRCANLFANLFYGLAHRQTGAARTCFYGGEEDLMAALDTVLEKIDANLESALARLFELIEIQSVSTDPAHDGDCETAAAWLAKELSSLGFEASVRPTAGHPMVVAHAKADRPDVPHLLFYGHYDVQPADPLELWETPPFEPRIVDAATGRRIVGRGVADDKGQLMTFIEAIPRL